jgi:hypothetical protein
MNDSLTRADEDKMVVKGSRATRILRLRATRLPFLFDAVIILITIWDEDKCIAAFTPPKYYKLPLQDDQQVNTLTHLSTFTLGYKNRIYVNNVPPLLGMLSKYLHKFESYWKLYKRLNQKQPIKFDQVL